MRRVRLMVLALTALTLALAAGATAASATTFYVNPAGNDGNPCTSPGAAACKTINGAVGRAEVDAGTSVIEVAAGVYPEEVRLPSAVEGLTLRGAGSGPGGTEVRGTVKSSAPVFEARGSGITLANLKVLAPEGYEGDAIRAGIDLTLDEVAIDVQATGDHDGIAFGPILAVGVLTINGGSITLENGNTGNGIDTYGYPVTVNGASLTLTDGATGSAVNAAVGPLSISNSSIALGKSTFAAVRDEAGAVTLVSDTITDSSQTGNALELSEPLPLTAKNVAVTMTNAKDTLPAVSLRGGSATLGQLRVGGTFGGSALQSYQSQLTVTDSTLEAGTGGTSPAVLAIAESAGETLLIQRSVVQAGATASGALASFNENVVVDSSEILGGRYGLDLEQSAGKTRALTVSASTIDAGVAGVADAAPVYDVFLAAVGGGGRAEATIQGSVLLEQQQGVMVHPGEHASIICRYSDAPSQSVAETAKEGSVSCGAGSNGNTSSAPASLFAAPLTSYILSTSSPAVRSVPTSAIALPYGFTPSATDLAGRARSVAIGTNGVCPRVQDRGALQLPGEADSCTPPPAKPSVIPLAVISALTLSPSSFAAAPSGATVSKAHRKYGTRISWRDSQAATTTFTILRKLPGRRQGRSCRKPSRSNRHGKRCTLLLGVGAFSHGDRAGTNSLHFSGRVKGRKLPAGAYELQALARDAAGRGKAVVKAFTIQ